MPSPVKSKQDFVRRYLLREFGNCSPSWGTLEQWLTNLYNRPTNDRFHIRKRIPWVLGDYTDQTPVMLIRNWRDLAHEYGEQNLYISTMAPEEKKIFQGEVALGPWGYYLYYNTYALPMRQGMALITYSAQGLRAKLLLDHYLCPNSREWLDYLLESYPNHVVEFSTYSVEWGTLPGYNTLFWEVRQY